MQPTIKDVQQELAAKKTEYHRLAIRNDNLYKETVFLRQQLDAALKELRKAKRAPAKKPSLRLN